MITSNNRNTRIRFWLYLAIPAGSLAASSLNPAVYNLHLVTDNTPDYTNLESCVKSFTDHLDSHQDKCIAVWRWGRRSRRHVQGDIRSGQERYAL